MPGSRVKVDAAPRPVGVILFELWNPPAHSILSAHDGLAGRGRKLLGHIGSDRAARGPAVGGAGYLRSGLRSQTAGISKAAEQPGPAAIEEYVCRKVKDPRAPCLRVRQAPAPILKLMHFSGENAAWDMSPGISHLAIVNISVENRPLSVGRLGQGAHRSWMACRGFGPGAWTARGASLPGVAQKLASLADPAALENAIQVRNQFLVHRLARAQDSAHFDLWGAAAAGKNARLKKDEPPALTRGATGVLSSRW